MNENFLDCENLPLWFSTPSKATTGFWKDGCWNFSIQWVRAATKNSTQWMEKTKVCLSPFRWFSFEYSLVIDLQQHQDSRTRGGLTDSAPRFTNLYFFELHSRSSFSFFLNDWFLNFCVVGVKEAKSHMGECWHDLWSARRLNYLESLNIEEDPTSDIRHPTPSKIMTLKNSGWSSLLIFTKDYL